MNKKGYILIAIISILLLFVIFKIVTRKKPLPEKFKTYRFLNETTIKSDTYEVKQLIDNLENKEKSPGIIRLNKIMHDKKTKNLIIFSEYEDNYPEIIRYDMLLKVNNQGKEIDSLKINYDTPLYNSGVIFEENYYIDWINTGSKVKQKYVNVIDGDRFSWQQLEDTVNRADSIDIAVSLIDKELEVRIFLKTVKGWEMIKSKKILPRIEEEVMIGKSVFSRKLPPFTNIIKKRFIPIENNMKWPGFNKVNPNPKLYLEYFDRLTNHSSGFSFSININGNAISGWSGMGYYKLIHNEDSIRFKAHTHEGDVYTSNIAVYCPPDETQDFVFIQVHKNKNGNRPLRNSGLYILHKK